MLESRILTLIAFVSLTPGSQLSAQAPLTSRDSAFHALNRLGYGPTPGQVDAVVREGVLPWIERQIAARGADTARSRLESQFDILRYSSSDLMRLYSEARAQNRARKDSTTDSTTPRMPATETQLTLRRIDRQLGSLAVARAITADHQLEEVMADFWANHFNVFSSKGLDRVFLPEYIEKVIRPRALGKFEDLLVATARSPAMLFYLDNVESVAANTAPEPMGRRAALRRQARGQDSMNAGRPRPTGINENYARELLELHTLGVDGGYTQDDVIAVARILTGWGIERPQQGGGFRFNPRVHDRGAKVVLGVEFPAGHDEDEGRRLLHLLATHPSTMRHVSAKLCARLVSDGDVSGCEDAAVAAWQRTDGDIREVLRAIVRSPDFWAAANVRAKVKTPLEFVVSAARAIGASPDSTPGASQAVADLGQPLFLQAAPIGYAETQEDWVNSGALLKRMNFAVALAGNHSRGFHPDLDRVVAAGIDPDAMLDAVDAQILGGTMTPNTRTVIRQQILGAANAQAARALAVGLALGGPEFQRQ